MISKRSIGWFLPLVLALCYVIGVASTETYMTTLPMVSKDLSIPMDQLSFTLGINFICAGIASFFSGLILNFFSKTSLQITTLLLFAFGSLLGFFATTLEILLIARLLQGLSSGVAQILGLAILKEVYTRKDFVRSVSRMTLFIESITSISPFIGSIITNLTNWRFPFLIFVVLAIGLCFLVHKEFPKKSSILQKPSNIPSKKFKNQIYTLLTTPHFVVWAFVGAFSNGGFWGFIAVAPYYFQEKQDISLVMYGFFQTLLAASYAVGAFIVEHQSKNARNFIIMSFYITISAGILFFIGEWIFQGVLILVGGILYGIANGILYPAVTGIVLSHTDEKTIGLSTSFYGLIRFTSSALCMLLFSQLYASFSDNFNFIMICLIGIILSGQFFARKKYPKNLYETPQSQGSII